MPSKNKTHTKCILCLVKIYSGETLCEGCQKLNLKTRIQLLAKRKHNFYSRPKKLISSLSRDLGGGKTE